MPESLRTTDRLGVSLFHRLEPLLEQVSKPIQYVGGELNSTIKDWDCGGVGPGGEELTARWALMYPDAYEIGLPNQGVMILYLSLIHISEPTRRTPISYAVVC